ncbi:hypothetical protein MRY82_00055 [bacterium]|nr:hypothetical protein [bacterium]
MQKNEQQPLWIQGWVKDNFSQAIEQAVMDAEKKCALDFFPVVVKSSSTLGHVFPLLSLVFLSLYLGAVFFIPLPNIGVWTGGMHALLMTILIILAYSLSENIGLARRLTAKNDQAYSVEQAARLAYFEHGIDQHPSILIYVSLMERQIVLLCNQDVQIKIKQVLFEQVLAEALPLLKHKKLQKALCQSINGLSIALAENFPLGEKPHSNALNNKVVIKNQ